MMGGGKLEMERVLTVAGSRGSFGDGGSGVMPIAEAGVNGGEMGDGNVLMIDRRRVVI